jgi:hypothetical protein
MIIESPVSLGELVDKLTILEIKEEMIQDTDKQNKAKKERLLLEERLKSLSLDGLDQLRPQLKDVNKKLWIIEDDIRECERQKSFGEEFIKLARSVYQTNDKRFEIKKMINVKYGSSIEEVKSYREY